jgi:hypothetical protein
MLNKMNIHDLKQVLSVVKRVAELNNRCEDEFIYIGYSATVFENALVVFKCEYEDQNHLSYPVKEECYSWHFGRESGIREYNILDAFLAEEEENFLLGKASTEDDLPYDGQIDNEVDDAILSRCGIAI